MGYYGNYIVTTKFPGYPLKSLFTTIVRKNACVRHFEVFGQFWRFDDL